MEADGAIRGAAWRPWWGGVGGVASGNDEEAGGVGAPAVGAPTASAANVGCGSFEGQGLNAEFCGRRLTELVSKFYHTCAFVSFVSFITFMDPSQSANFLESQGPSTFPTHASSNLHQAAGFVVLNSNAANTFIMMKA